MHTDGLAPYAEEEYTKDGTFHTNCFFIGGNLRNSVAEGRADFIPIFLSEIPGLFRRKLHPVDVCLIQVSPPDQHGYCSLGTSVDIMVGALQSATHIIAMIN